MTVTVTIRGQVREVEVRELTYTDGSPRYVSAGNVALFQKRPGQTLWPAPLRFRKEADGTLVPLFQETILNRAGYRAVAWNDEVSASKAIERNLSQHNSARPLPAAEFHKGDRVVPSGEGRTARWPKRPGTVTRKIAASTWEVVWDGTSFGDEMGADEITLATGEVAKKPAAEPTDLRQIQHRLDAVLGAERLDDKAAEACGIRLYDATDRNGRPIKVTIPENDNA